MNSKSVPVSLVIACALLVKTFAAPTTTTTQAPIDVGIPANVACGTKVFPGNDLAMLFPPSDLTLPNIINSTLAALVQKQSMATFCAKRELYTTCVIDSLKNPVAPIDELLKVYVDIENFDSAFQLYCNNSVLISEAFECTRQAALTNSSCVEGGIVGITGQVFRALEYQITQTEFCTHLTKSIECRVQHELRPCGAEYANIMENVYYNIVGKYCPKPIPEILP